MTLEKTRFWNSHNLRLLTTWARRAALALVFLFAASPRVDAAAPAAESGHVKVLRFGKLIDGKGKKLTNAVVIVDKDRIRSVGDDSTPVPADAPVYDLTRYTAIPGLIDVHTHLTYYWDQKPETKPWEALFARMPAVNVFLAQENARKTLEAGVTTARDLGSFEYMDLAMRELINRGAMLGPRMLVAGYGLQISDEPQKPGHVTPPGGRADGVPEVLRVVRQQIGAGVDWIKIYGSSGSADDVTGYQTFSFEEIKAAVEAAHRFNKRVAIHTYGPAAARDAVRAGVDSIEHPIDLDDATLAEMVQRHIFYVPTIDHNRYYADSAKQFGYGADVVAKLRDFVIRNLETTRRAFRAGVRIAMGSDAVMTMFGQNTRELEWFVRAGMSPEQALATATTNAAALLGMEQSLGALAPGYYADIVAVDGDPLTDIQTVINGVRWVMRGGYVVVNHLPLPRSAAP
jgi:imidazolonepropionase-like amidohydrolase